MLLSVANSRPRNLETVKTSSLFPESIQENADLFISFIEKYYEYMNLVGLPSGELSNITSDKDIDRASNKYLTEIQSLIARNVPESTVLDKVSLYKIILQYYRTRGSEDSIYAFFKLFFNELITVFYPRDYLFELSQGSGSWRDIDFNSLKTSATNPNKNRIKVISNITIGPEGAGLDSKSIELIYFSNDIWTYDGRAINTQFPYLEKIQTDADEYRWKYCYRDLIIYSNNDSEWPDEAQWSALERSIYYEAAVNIEKSLLENGMASILENGIDFLLENSIAQSTKKLEYNSGNTWDLLGNVISGDEINSYLGNSSSLSADGMRLAIGSSYFGDTNDDSGHSRVYKLDDRTSSWIQIGQDLTSGLNNDSISYSLQLSDDGNRVVVSAADALNTTVGTDYGSTRVYQYIAGSNRWKQIGQTIIPFNINATANLTSERNERFIVEQSVQSNSNYGAKFISEGVSTTFTPTNFFGTKIAFSGDGTTLAITYLFQYSSTVVYKYNVVKRLWEIFGGVISGNQADDLSGYSISLNYNGTVIAIGSPKYDNINSIDDGGKVSIYRYSSSSKSWTRSGNELFPNNQEGDWYGFSVSLDSIGDIVAIGTINGKNQEGVTTGYTQIFKYDTSSQDWNQIGQTIYGNNEYDYGGFNVALNANGTICAVSYKSEDTYSHSESSTLNHSIDSGVIRVYQYNDIVGWVQLANDITSETVYDYVGSTLAISSDGLTVATGSVGVNDPDGSVRVYNLDIVRDIKFYNSIELQAIPEFALSYGEIINSLENYPDYKIYKTISIDPIIWSPADITRQWTPIDRKSFASDAYKIHDGYYWQKYSYDIKTSKATAEWLDDYLKFVHPAGLQLFASILMQLTSTQRWSEYVDYAAAQPQQDFMWISTQRAPHMGAHSPYYQPGWLSINARRIDVFARALRLNEQDINLYNLVYHILHIYLKNTNFRDKNVREDWQRWIKFLDVGELIAGYSDKTIAQASEEYAFNNVCKFSNISVIIDVLSDGIYLENKYPRNLESNFIKLTESRKFEITTTESLMENNQVKLSENGGTRLRE
jgi:hypothetical protein